jgi:hypothetical protein
VFKNVGTDIRISEWSLQVNINLVNLEMVTSIFIKGVQGRPGQTLRMITVCHGILGWVKLCAPIDTVGAWNDIIS